MKITNTSGALLDESFEYTSWGSVSRLTDNLRASRDMGYAYDDLQRVKTTEGAVNEAYAYDAFGNRALRAGGAISQQFDEHNRLTGGVGVVYDEAGRVTNDGVHKYGYDGNGLITRVDDNVRYVYDAEGNRVRKVLPDGVHEFFWWNDQLLAERAPDGSWTDYVYAGGNRFASIQSHGQEKDAQRM